MQITQERSRSEAERSSHSAVQQQLSELEKEKMLIDLELKDAYARHKTEISRRDTTISNVRGFDVFISSTHSICLYWFIFVLSFFYSVQVIFCLNIADL